MIYILLFYWLLDYICIIFNDYTIVIFCFVFALYCVWYPDLQESDRGATHKTAATPICFQRYKNIAVQSILGLLKPPNRRNCTKLFFPMRNYTWQLSSSNPAIDFFESVNIAGSSHIQI